MATTTGEPNVKKTSSALKKVFWAFLALVLFGQLSKHFLPEHAPTSTAQTSASISKMPAAQGVTTGMNLPVVAPAGPAVAPARREVTDIVKFAFMIDYISKSDDRLCQLRGQQLEKMYSVLLAAEKSQDPQNVAYQSRQIQTMLDYNGDCLGGFRAPW